jgi:hypothetical protein
MCRQGRVEGSSASQLLQTIQHVVSLGCGVLAGIIVSAKDCSTANH